MHFTMPTDWLCCAYLRKSREDEQRDREYDSDTLARHQSIIEDLAEENSHTVRQWYREVVSGETIAARPEMTSLLHDIANGKWDAVYVVEASRLGRGGGADQERIINALRYTGTWLVTESNGIYDPDSDTDMKRLKDDLRDSEDELGSITTRLTRGSRKAVKDGRWLATGRAPYGWRAVRIRGAWQLEPDENHDNMLRIYDMLEAGDGFATIAATFNHEGIPTLRGGEHWTPSAIQYIARNPANCGYVVYGVHKTRRVFDPDTFEVHKVKEKNDKPLIYKGLHFGKGGIPPERFEKIIGRRAQDARIQKDRQLRNPLATLLRCGKCGKCLTVQLLNANKPSRALYFAHKPAKRYTGTCSGVKGVKVDTIMELLADALESMCNDIEIQIASSGPDDYEARRARIIKEQEKAIKSRDRAMEAFEAGVYTLDDFAERKRAIESRIEKLDEALAQCKPKEPLGDTIVNLKECIRAIKDDSLSAKDKNDLLKSFIDHIDYYNGETRPRHHDIKLEVFLR